MFECEKIIGSSDGDQWAGRRASLLRAGSRDRLAGELRSLEPGQVSARVEAINERGHKLAAGAIRLWQGCAGQKKAGCARPPGGRADHFRAQPAEVAPHQSKQCRQILASLAPVYAVQCL